MNASFSAIRLEGGCGYQGNEMTLACSGHAIAWTPYCLKALSDLLLILKYSKIISFSKMVAHADILLSKCAQFRNESQFIDVRLKVGEDIFPAHRIVLAASSNYFYAMFTDGMKESSQEVIELKDESISSDVLKILLDSIYTGDRRGIRVQSSCCCRSSSSRECCSSVL